MDLRSVAHHFIFGHQTSVLQKVDSTIYQYTTDKCQGNQLRYAVDSDLPDDSNWGQINLYPVDSAISFPNTYPLDGAIQRLNNRGQIQYSQK